MQKVIIFALAVFGVANAGVIGGLGLGVAGVGPLGLAGINQLGLAGINQLGLTGINQLGLAGINQIGLAGINHVGLAGINQLGLAGISPIGIAGISPLGLAGVGPLGLAGVGVGAIGVPGVLGAVGAIGASGTIVSNPGGTIAAAVPGINIGIDEVGPKTAATVVGVQTVINGPSATLIASTGAVKGVASAGANINSAGIKVAPSAAGGNVPASVVAIQKIPVVVQSPVVAGLGAIW